MSKKRATITRNSDPDKQRIESFLSFLAGSPTACHAVENCSSALLKENFVCLKEEDLWKIEPGGRYFVVRNRSSLCAFIAPKKKPIQLNIAASHTDSPALKLKPNAEFYKENMLCLGLEMYGSPLLSSWLNRDLKIAGRVIYKDKAGLVKDTLVDLDKYPALIPQLAIHLDRGVNENGTMLNKQQQLVALASISAKTKDHPAYIESILKEHLPIDEIFSTDLYLVPMEQPRLFGDNQQMIASYRIDSLASVHAILTAFIHDIRPSDHAMKMMVLWDNEEVGSQTAQGAGSPFAMQVLERLMLSLSFSREDYLRLLARSLCVSVDLSHAMPPNYSDKHEPHHLVLLNKGIVIKTNAQHRYASDAHSIAVIVRLCKEGKIPFQYYVSRGDIPCGSTIGPIHAALSGMATVDIGSPQLSMHSCREIAGTIDHLSMCSLLSLYFSATE